MRANAMHLIRTAGVGLLLAGAGRGDASKLVTVVPKEDPDAVLHNPDMGWVVYENYPLDRRPGGSSTLLGLPGDDFPGVTEVALMFAWSDVEAAEDKYDFTHVDFAYDYWLKRGKRIQLRLSTEPLLWWAAADPPSGLGVPGYVLAKLPADRKQTRTMDGLPYTVADARDPFYRERLENFLTAAAKHFANTRPVTLVDLRGFGLWGEWHQGFKYPTLDARREALVGVIDRYADAFRDNFLSLSYSYDPDGPKGYWAGPRDRFDPAATNDYAGYLRYSAFDHALTRANVTFRRDGCGGAVHSNERKLNAEAFATLAKGPMMSEFVDGYAGSKKAGAKWVGWKVEDALSLHPNYVNLLGWQGADARDFLRERPDLIARGLRTMGYRLVPTAVRHPEAVAANAPFPVETDWVNRGVGRAVADFRLELRLADAAGKVVASADAGPLGADKWAKGKTYPVAKGVRFAAPAGAYDLRLTVTDPRTGKPVGLPLAGGRPDGSYPVGPVRVTP